MLGFLPQSSENKLYFIFSLRKEGHYRDFSKVVSNLLENNGYRTVLVDTTIKQLLLSFFSFRIIFIDGDKKHLLFAPIIIIRSWFKFKNYMFSIRTENVFTNKIHKILKYPIYIFLRKFSNTKIISIHKENIREEYEKIITHFIYDIQYWDLKYLNINIAIPSELEKFDFSNSIAIIGEFNEKKSRSELLSFLKDYNRGNFTFIFAGKVNEKDKEFLMSHSKCVVINRYIANEELFYVYEKCEFIWCYYSTQIQRPSGIFGRALQLGKKIIVRDGGYLARSNRDYPCLIKMKQITDLFNKKDNCSLENWENKKDSSNELLDILTN